MAVYLIRVVLHDGTYGDYQRLHQHLTERGATDLVRSDDGARYRLPDGEYLYQGDESLETVMDAVTQLAQAVGRAAVLVSESTGSAWSGLDAI